MTDLLFDAAVFDCDDLVETRACWLAEALDVNESEPALRAGSPSKRSDG